MDGRRVHEAVEAPAARGRPGGRAPQHDSTVEAHPRRRVAAQAIVEGVEGEPAEAVELGGPPSALASRRVTARDPSTNVRAA